MRGFALVLMLLPVFVACKVAAIVAVAALALIRRRRFVRPIPFANDTGTQRRAWRPFAETRAPSVGA